MVEALVWIVALGVIIAFMWRGRGRPPRRIGSASVGTVYDMLNEDKRKAVEIVVADKAAAHEFEHGDDDGPTGEQANRRTGNQ